MSTNQTTATRNPPEFHDILHKKFRIVELHPHQRSLIMADIKMPYAVDQQPVQLGAATDCSCPACRPPTWPNHGDELSLLRIKILVTHTVKPSRLAVIQQRQHPLLRSTGHLVINARNAAPPNV